MILKRTPSSMLLPLIGTNVLVAVGLELLELVLVRVTAEVELVAEGVALMVLWEVLNDDVAAGDTELNPSLPANVEFDVTDFSLF